jgi:alpha-glucosidase
VAQHSPLSHQRIHCSVFFFGLLYTILLSSPAIGQGLGAVTRIQIDGNALILSASSDVIVFKACSEKVLMVNLRQKDSEDSDRLVVAKTDWPNVNTYIDTTGTTLRLGTASYVVEIERNPLRFHLYGSSEKGSSRFLCEEPSAGGISQGKLTFQTSGGTFFGVHNRTQGSLSTPTGGNVFAGNQGQAGGPFAWTTNGWGFLADADGGNIAISSTTFSFERPASTSEHDFEWYFLIGSPKEIIKGFHDLTGFPPLFPKYTLGFMNTEWGIDQTELYNNIRMYRAKSIPIDAYILDFDWMDWGSDDYGEFRWGPKFPDGPSGALTDSLKQYGMHLMGIRKPRVHTGTIEGNYAQSQGFFTDIVTDYFSGKTVGRMNFNIPDARRWFWESFAIQCGSYNKGITGYWNDEADEYGGNFMFMQMQRAMYEGQRLLNNKRVWSVNRNYYSGAQRYAYGLWSGDIRTGFQTMAEQRLFMLSSITLGASWWGMDIGGFSGSPSPENYYRWIQFGTFVPIFRVHGTLNQEREPWNYGALAESLSTKSIRLRYRLMPYIYSAAWENHLMGLSIARPLVFEYPDDAEVLDLSSEWMFGPSLLVSPVVSAGATQQSVYLPQGTWLDFETGQSYAGGMRYTVDVKNDHIPLYVKAGSLIPMSPPAQYVDAPEMLKEVILSSYPGGTGESTVYDDDGITYEYESGLYSTTKLGHDRNESRALIEVGPRSGAYVPAQRDWLCQLHWVTSTPESVLIDGMHTSIHRFDSLNSGTIRGWGYDATSQECIVRLPDDGQSHSIAVHFNRSASGTKLEPSGPEETALSQNYPNPFNPETKIGVRVWPARLSESAEAGGGLGSSWVRLAVYDLLGREVRVLMNERKEPGRYEVKFDATGLASGVYIYRLTAGSFVMSRKMLLLQ